MFFHVGCILLLQQHHVSALQLGLAWVFVAGRVAHSGVHILTAHVRWRGVVFTVNFVAVLGMWFFLLLGRSG